MIFNVRSEAASVRDTASTLGFAQRAMAIQNVAKVNEVTDADAAILRRENKRLRRELEMYRAVHKVGQREHDWQQIAAVLGGLK